MFTDTDVEEAAKKTFCLENWNNFVGVLRGRYPELPKNYEWMRVYNNTQPKKFLSVFFTDAVEHYAGDDPLMRIALSAFFVIGLVPSVISSESIAEVLQHLVDIAY